MVGGLDTDTEPVVDYGVIPDVPIERDVRAASARAFPPEEGFEHAAQVACNHLTQPPIGLYLRVEAAVRKGAERAG